MTIKKGRVALALTEKSVWLISNNKTLIKHHLPKQKQKINFLFPFISLSAKAFESLFQHDVQTISVVKQNFTVIMIFLFAFSIACWTKSFFRALDKFCRQKVIKKFTAKFYEPFGRRRRNDGHVSTAFRDGETKTLGKINVHQRKIYFH